MGDVHDALHSIPFQKTIFSILKPKVAKSGTLTFITAITIIHCLKPPRPTEPIFLNQIFPIEALRATMAETDSLSIKSI